MLLTENHSCSQGSHTLKVMVGCSCLHTRFNFFTALLLSLLCNSSCSDSACNSGQTVSPWTTDHTAVDAAAHPPEPGMPARLTCTLRRYSSSR